MAHWPEANFSLDLSKKNITANCTHEFKFYLNETNFFTMCIFTLSYAGYFKIVFLKESPKQKIKKKSLTLKIVLILIS